MPTMKIFRFIGGQNGINVATTESLIDARILIAHLLTGHRIIHDKDKVSDEEMISSRIGHFEVYRQRDLYNFETGNMDKLDPIYTSPYYYTSQYD